MRMIISAGFLATIQASAAVAEPPMTSMRPMPRPAASMGAVYLAANDVVESLRPEPRPKATTTLAAKTIPARATTELDLTADAAGFPGWVSAFRRRALAQGIRADVLDRSFRDVTFDESVIRLDRNQSEFVKPIWEYLDSAVSESRITNGKAQLAKYGPVLDRIERQYGVDKQAVLAIWGMETNYGTFRGSSNTIRSLATLAYEGRRADFFEAELIQALKIIQEGHVTPEQMKGSWAGAMGHTQFMPSSFWAHAVDFTGDGKRDLWSDDPSDALASTASYLKHFGWTKGQPWGVEVQLPPGFDFTLANRAIVKSPGEWSAMGVRDMDGRAVRDYGEASILLPAGGRGAAFMIFGNFRVIERYNPADAYVIGVGHLGDRIMGGPPIRGAWPRGDRGLTLAERKELQQRLTERGFDTEMIDGRIGPRTISALRSYQIAEGIMPDGYPSLRLLERMR